ncbi:MAG: hypothetical protein QMD08_03030 [Actinomycetota bacterium]|nr:hypothetical protein [Actinomycetota bacterium]
MKLKKRHFNKPYRDYALGMATEVLAILILMVIAVIIAFVVASWCR